MAGSINLEDFKDVYVQYTRRERPEISETDKLESLNLDSLAMLEIVGELEKKAGREVDEDELADLQTFGDLIRIINEAEAI